ncbi:unnamed protein product [Urochloa humidicola]
MHDIIGGPGQTAIHLIRNAGPPHESLKGAYFGDTMAIDDPVTEGPGIIGSGPVVGQARGTYMLSSKHEEVLVASGLGHRRAHQRALQRQLLRLDRPRRDLRRCGGAHGRWWDGQAPASGGTRRMENGEGGVRGVHCGGGVELIVDMSVPANTAAPGNRSLAI